MNIAEGFDRYGAGEFSQFLRVSRGCTGEALGWLKDGVARGHYSSQRIERALDLGTQTKRLITGLIKSLLPFTKRRPRDIKQRRKRRRPSRRRAPPKD